MTNTRRFCFWLKSEVKELKETVEELQREIDLLKSENQTLQYNRTFEEIYGYGREW